MTNREFYTAIAANETLTEEIRNHATELIAKLDATAEKRKGKVSAKDQAKRDENAAMATHIAEAFLGAEPKTASDIAALLTAETGEEVKPQKASYLELNKGDMVLHAAFGRGLVLSVMKMGGDALLEIAFDQIGTKKLMAMAATPHMKKL